MLDDTIYANIFCYICLFNEPLYTMANKTSIWQPTIQKSMYTDPFFFAISMYCASQTKIAPGQKTTINLLEFLMKNKGGYKFILTIHVSRERIHVLTASSDSESKHLIEDTTKLTLQLFEKFGY